MHLNQKFDICIGLALDNLVGLDNIKSKVNLAQDKMYLLEIVGVDLGFHFIWFGGPISTDLRRRIDNNVVWDSWDNLDNLDINGEVMDMLNKVNSLESYKPENIDCKTWYNTLASIVFIHKHYYMWSDTLDKNNVVDVALSENKCLDKINCDKAFDLLLKDDIIKY